MQKYHTHHLRAHFRVMLLAAIVAFTGSISAYSQVDMMIRDCHSDVGNQPDYDCYDYYYNSPDIWIRNQPDGLTNQFHQAPSAGGSCYVYVRLRNIGGSTLGSGMLHLYFGSASVSLGNWPSRWNSYYPGGIVKGDAIGSACVSNVCPSCTTIVEIPWTNVPANSSGDHWCLLARFVSAEDPMAFAEGLYIHDNVMNNNNIAWKNLTQIYPSYNQSTVDIYNGHYRCEDTKETEVHFNLAEDEHGLFYAFNVRADLGPEGFAIWEAGNRRGEGIVQDEQPNTIRITAPDAWIGLTLQPEQGFATRVQFEYPVIEYTSDDGEVYTQELPDGVIRWNITHREDGRGDVLGGEAYEIYLRDNGQGQGKTVRRADPNLGMKLDLRAYPNVAKASTTIGFKLPENAPVTLAIYDASGNLVRTLLANETRNAGAHEVTWDGTADGTHVANGTYFYRLVTPEGTVEQQMKIVR